jgi:tetratricopeptide (TPR) repeat protein
VENAYYKWLGERSSMLWESDSKTMSGPHIVVRHLPPGISSRAQRDSVFAAAMPEPSKVNRLELWCWDCSKAFLRIGDYARAEEWGRRALRIQVKSMEAPVQGQLAVALLRQGQVDSAEVHMKRALALSPKDARFRAYYAQILTGLGRLPEALTELRRAYELSGGDPRIRINIAQVLGQLGRFDEAVAELLLVPPGDPQRGLALRDAAILILNHLDRPAEALNYLRESIELDPNQEQADLVRAQIAKLEAGLIRRR